MLRTTFGQLWVNSALPEDLRDYNRVLDKAGTKELFQQLADRYPDKYREVAHQLSNIGQRVAYSTGGHSVSPEHLRPTVAVRQMRLDLRRELRQLLGDRSLSREDRNAQIVALAKRHQAPLVKAVQEESKAEDNPLYQQMIGAGRGNEFTLNSLRGADLLYTDHHGQDIPIPVLHSYAEGLTPAEYFAGAFGARKGLIDLKAATGDAGFFGKQLLQANHRLLVSADDDETPYDPSRPRGLPVDTTDPANVGGLLAHPVAGYPRNTRLTPRLLKELKGHGFDQILVRSPIVGGPGDGGVYAKDVGYRERGRLSPLGDYVGIGAAQSLTEPVTQAQISSKHAGGVSGASAGAISGFKYINALVQAPKVFPGTATHAQLDGRVTGVRPAPQGGNYVDVQGERHYVPHDLPVTVKAGDEVEAGDTLSEGIGHPAEIVKHKGLGEGQRYFVEAFGKAFKDSNVYGHRRNIELLAKGLLNHVRLTDEYGDWVPGDVLPYSQVERTWQPRPGSVMMSPQTARGQYLEKPILHYTIGTKVGKRMLEMLDKHGVKNIEVHKEPPPFQPEMTRAMAHISQDPDWMSRFLGSYQQKSLLRGVHRGDVSDSAGTSFVPALAEGTDFGLKGITKGWEPEK